MGCKKLAYYQYENHSLRAVWKNPAPFPEQVAAGKTQEKTAIDYYPFGMMMPGRSFNPTESRYGFNGKEMDNELKGAGNSYDFGARMQDPRTGRWLSLEPLARLYPSLSPYCFVGNTPIIATDPDGKKIVIVTASGKRIVYKPMMTIAGDEFVQQTIAELNSLYQSGGGKELVQRAVDERKTVKIKQRPERDETGAISHPGWYDPENKTISYDPNVGAIVTNTAGEDYGFLDSRRILTHELRHFMSHASLGNSKFNYTARLDNPLNMRLDKKWGNIEEYNVIKADNLAFPTQVQRTEHEGTAPPSPEFEQGRGTTGSQPEIVYKKTTTGPDGASTTTDAQGNVLSSSEP